jgi:hypothetical protein
MPAKKPRAKKATPRKRPARKPAAAKPKFGRPGTAGKAEGDEAVRAWIAAVKPEHQPIVKALDRLVTDEVPGVKKALKWSTPLYGLPGIGWFCSVASFKNYVSLVFFAGASLDPPPPFGEGKGMRRINIEDASEVDEKRFRAWIRQASKIKGWGSL